MTASMSTAIMLVGVDCGSTTSSMVAATARLVRRGGQRNEIDSIEEIYRSGVVFTPFDGNRIDAARFEEYLDAWLAEAGIAPGDIFGGGALVTGLAAEAANARAVTRLIEARMAESVVAVANDPCFEAWLAFMGNCHAQSRAQPTLPVLNLDIGGGTTNLALGLDGQVLSTGCLLVGARHFQFEKGTHRLTQLSSYAGRLLEHLGIKRGAGDTLAPDEIDKITGFYLDLLTDAVAGKPEPNAAVAAGHVQVRFELPRDLGRPPVIMLSGGVGQLVHECLAGRKRSDTTPFGDLGVELAERIASSPLAKSMTIVPEALGRATAYGLLRHSTEVSGSTIYLPHPEHLPLANVPILGRIDPQTSPERLDNLLALAERSGGAACLQVDLAAPRHETIRDLGERLAALLIARPVAGPARRD